MATESEDPFLTRTGLIRRDLEKRFGEYQLSLQRRKDELSAKLDAAEREYTTSRVEYKQKLQAIEQIQTSIKQQTAAFKSMEHSLLANVNKQILQIKDEYPERGIELVLDATFYEKIQTLGQINVTILPKHKIPLAESCDKLDEKMFLETAPILTVEAELKSNTKQKDWTKPLPRDYSRIKYPIMSAVKQGDGACDLRYPQKVAVDSKTGNIFIADQTSHCVKIYSQEGKYLENVQYTNRTINKYEPVHPYGVCFYGDSLYVTSLISSELKHCIFKFNRDSKSDTKFTHSISHWIHGTLFKRPSVISADQANGDVYVCDDESKVQVLDNNLSYKRMLTNNQSKIADIQVAKERVYLLCGVIQILSKQSGVVQILSKQSGLQLKCFEFDYQLNPPTSMYITADSFIILNGFQGEHIITVIREANMNEIAKNRTLRSFDNLGSFSIEPNPAGDGCFAIRGIAVEESTQKIIVVCYSKDNMIQIY